VSARATGARFGKLLSLMNELCLRYSPLLQVTLSLTTPTFEVLFQTHSTDASSSVNSPSPVVATPLRDTDDFIHEPNFSMNQRVYREDGFEPPLNNLRCTSTFNLLSASSLLSYTDNRRLRRTSFNVSPVFVVFRATPTIKCGWGMRREFELIISHKSEAQSCKTFPFIFGCMRPLPLGLFLCVSPHIPHLKPLL